MQTVSSPHVYSTHFLTVPFVQCDPAVTHAMWTTVHNNRHHLQVSIETMKKQGRVEGFRVRTTACEASLLGEATSMVD
ncbi:hypothetical protein KC19_VG111700 [Ceratodon purpureus]|uniref:Uncharacterized protein n=1 Tax=Ceratodon purpureus TaxID=3225 RepID=A0A8T0HPV9_CERPU|nr:hypothetical protein KC19_VG111700 [Ceratodon purpureus]